MRQRWPHLGYTRRSCIGWQAHVGQSGDEWGRLLGIILRHLAGRQLPHTSVLANRLLCSRRDRATVATMPKWESGSRVLHEEAGFRYSIATEERRDEIVRVLSESFCREPMGVALRVSASDIAPLVERFMPECTSNGLSVIATPADEPETVAGVFISRDFKSALPEGVPEEFPWFLPIGQALMTVDEAYEEKRRDLKIGDAVDLWMVGVAEGRFARRGIASTLFRICSGVARDRGFMCCVTECTGHYSQTAAQRAGFKEVARLAYKEFRFEGRPVFADIGPPHTHLVLYEREF